jgi:hypothetical protein
VFFCFLVLYAWTAQRGVSWQDSGYFQYRMLTADFTGAYGLALSHPLYLLLAQGFALLFPQGGTCYAINLFSGVGLALAAAVLFALVTSLTGSRRCGVLASVTLGLSHMAWWLATLAEVYTWSLACLMLEVACLARICGRRDFRWVVALFGLNGAHFAIHPAALLGLPVYGCVAWAVVRRGRGAEGRVGRVLRYAGRAGALAGVWLIGAGPLMWLTVAVCRESGDAAGTFASLLFGTQYQGAVLGTARPAWGLVRTNLLLAGASLLSPCWLLAARGWGAARGRPFFRAALLGLTVTHALFWVRYFVPDQATFVLPTLGLAAVWMGMGAARYGARTVTALLAVGMCVQVALPPLLAHTARCFAARGRTLPFRDEARYWLVPWKHNERSAQRFAAAVDRQLNAGDLLIGDRTAVNPVMAARAAKTVGTAWRLVSEWNGETEAETLTLAAAALREGRRVYVVSPVPGYAPAALLARYAFAKEGVLWRVREKR